MCRFLLGLFLSILLVSCNEKPEQKPKRNLNGIQIIRNGATVEIFKNGELVGEFAPRNTDSASMRTLYFIDALLKEK